MKNEHDDLPLVGDGQGRTGEERAGTAWAFAKLLFWTGLLVLTIFLAYGPK